MVAPIISAVVNKLVSNAIEVAKEQVRLVACVDKDLVKLKSNFLAIQARLVDAEQRQFEEEAIRFWLDELKHASYDLEDVLDEWITASLKRQIEGDDDNDAPPVSLKKKVCSFFSAPSCFGCKRVLLRWDIALKIKATCQTLDEIARRKDMFNLSLITSSERSEWIPTTSLINISEVHGRDEEKTTLKSKLLCESSEQQNAIQIISIVGMAGIGKTTLAQLVYNDTDVINNFEKKIWVCVSEPFDLFRIAKAILEALEGSTPNLGELQSLLQRLCSSIARKKFLLVLDDVWTEDRNKWEPLHNCLLSGGNGSKILVTTRKESVAQMMESTGVVFIKELNEQECWSLFKRFAFFERAPSDCEQLEEIGKKIVDKCKGLPLAAKTMGCLLRFKRSREEWQIILDSELWQLKEFGKDISPSLLLSYNDLPYEIKQCFSYCAIFMKDYVIKKDELIRLWMAQGFIRPEENKEMEVVGEEYFSYLASRSFFQEFREDGKGTIISCKMHDLIHDFAQFLTKNECVAIDSLLAIGSSILSKSYFVKKLRHLTLVRPIMYLFPNSIIKANKLRSLLIDGDGITFNGGDIIYQLTCLKTLKMVCGLGEIPKEIRNLTHLRYLKLEGAIIEKLPEACCELFNLQTLEIVSCSHLKELPEGIGRLVNLRHLIFEDVRLEYMPKGIERLTSLRTLSKFVRKFGRVDGSKACELEGLKHLNHLRGFIRIELHGNVRKINEAKNADLEKKKNLLGLELDYSMDLENEADYVEICEALRPPENLESLKMEHYISDNRWPNWMVSLHKLKKLRLQDCDCCETMPPLGKLPSLEILQVWGSRRMKRVGDEFLGIKKRDDVHGGTSSSVIAFPKLKQLLLGPLREWEEWDFGNEDIEIMPQLNYLFLGCCCELRSLPDQIMRSTTLKKLEIYNCGILEQRLKEDWTKISHIPNIKIY